MNPARNAGSISSAFDDIRGAGTFRALSEAVRRTEFSNLNTREIAAVVRKLPTLERPEPSVRIALLGTHTISPLPDYLSARAVASGRVIEYWTGPYGQYMQPVSPPAPELREFQPDIILLSAQMRSISPRVAFEFASLTEQDADSERRRILNHLLEWAELAAEATHATVLVCNFPRPRYTTFGIADAKRVPSEAAFYLRLNLELLEALRRHARIGLLDLGNSVAGFGGDRAWADRMYYLSKQPWEPGLCISVSRDLWRHVIAVKGWARKCLVLDLDNTLWGGVVGEEGPLGIKIEPGDPEGEAFADFQRAVRAVKARGILLAVASKNNPEEVDAVFEQRPEMPLRKEDFAIMKVGWGSKVHSLEAIAESLNIGTDSLVFLDDDPSERAIVRGAMPEVFVPELPSDPAHFASFLKRQGWFEKSSLTQEDLNKTGQYKAQADRAAFSRTIRNIDRYLAELETVVEVRRARPADIERIHQLVTKTNQFNVTTPRYSIGELEAFAESQSHVLGVAGARDRFGDFGLIGVYLLEVTGRNVEIEALLLSCRALGRGIETVVMNAIKKEARQAGTDEGLLLARFVPTRKNAPAREYFESQGLKAIDGEPGGETRYQLPIADLADIEVPHVGVA